MAPIEARAVQRFPGTIGPLQVRPNGKSFAVEVHDFSILGIGLLADKALSAGTVLIIESGGLGKPIEPLSAEVRHATQLPDGDWLLGCRFSRFLTIADLGELQAARPAIFAP